MREEATTFIEEDFFQEELQSAAEELSQVPDKYLVEAVFTSVSFLNRAEEAIFGDRQLGGLESVNALLSILDKYPTLDRQLRKRIARQQLVQ